MAEYVPIPGQGGNRIALARIDSLVSAKLGPARVRGNAQPAAFNRQVAMYLAHRVGGWSTTRIGRFYNGRDHSTVCHAIKRIQALRNSNEEIESLLSSLIQELGTDTSGSWLNLVERLFAEVTERCVRRGSHTSVRSLEKAMLAYLDQRNENPKPFIWTADADLWG